VIATAAATGIAESRVHWEQFAAAAPAAGAAFTVVLARSGTELHVEEGMTILQAIENPRPPRSSACAAKACAVLVKQRFLKARAEHFDQYLR
jgi:hypothetical protein